MTRHLLRWISAFMLAIIATGGVALQASAAACVPPEIDISQYTDDGVVDLESYLAAVAAANAICEGVSGAGVSLTPDDVPPVVEVIGSEGGTVLVTSSNGVVFRLVIPAGAVDEEVSITMRPVTLTTSAGSSIAAVHFAPEDLQFNPAATLTITFPDGVPTNMALYRYEGVGANLSQISYSQVDDDTVSTAIPHFSGVAAFATTVPDDDGDVGGLPETGSNAAALVPYGLILAGMGIVAVNVARHRRQDMT